MRKLHMTRPCFWFSLCLFILGLQNACTTPYYGYTKSDWEKLSEAEKQAIMLEYNQVLQAKRNLKHDDQLEARKQSIINRAVNH